MSKKIKRLLIIALPFTLLLFSGCVSTGAGGGGFDLVKFLKNPIVIIIIALVIVWYLYNKGKK